MSGGASLILAVLARRPCERRWALAGALSDDGAALDDRRASDNRPPGGTVRFGYVSRKSQRCQTAATPSHGKEGDRCRIPLTSRAGRSRLSRRRIRIPTPPTQPG
jgi:hypothetical protein